jgi:hypothetical protein
MMKNSKIIFDKIDESIGCLQERSIINRWMLVMHSYYKIQINYSIGYQCHYINAILCAVDYLYTFYDLDPIYFSLLDYAIRTLERLLTTDDQREMLAEYCDKTAVVFQTAADKTRQDPIYKKIWSDKAKEYKSKADAIRGITPDAPYEERIMHLYRTFAESAPHDFIRDLLMDNYRRYESRLQPAGSEPEEIPLRSRCQPAEVMPAVSPPQMETAPQPEAPSSWISNLWSYGRAFFASGTAASAGEENEPLIRQETEVEVPKVKMA